MTYVTRATAPPFNRANKKSMKRDGGGTESSIYFTQNKVFLIGDARQLNDVFLNVVLFE